MKVGDLVKYMSRLVLITGFDTRGSWVYGIELDDDRAEVGKYKSHVLRVINESR
jgi:hypothetical protein